jgi:hypothetical protein
MRPSLGSAAWSAGGWPLAKAQQQAALLFAAAMDQSFSGIVYFNARYPADLSQTGAANLPPATTKIPISLDFELLPLFEQTLPTTPNGSLVLASRDPALVSACSSPPFLKHVERREQFSRRDNRTSIDDGH